MVEQLNPKEHMERVSVLSSKLEYDPEIYEFKDDFVPGDTSNPMDVHTTAEMIEALYRNPKIEVDAKILASNGSESRLVSVNRESFLHGFKTDAGARFKEADGFYSDPMDYHLTDRDFVPLLGGPFYKNMYFYQDYIRMHSAAFYAYHHDPAAKSIVEMTKNFTVGRGFRVDSDNKQAMVIWRAFEQVNYLQQQIEQLTTELAIYGEHMIWWLPNNETKIVYRPGPNDTIPVGLIPRIRLIDPSNIVEIITDPADITKRFAYVWLAPTQYQIYTQPENKPDQAQPGIKFIYRHIPADEILHYKVNGVSNEKRGRSDYFNALGYMKRLRDAVDYVMISHNKQSAWSIDTSIEGSQQDITNYVNALRAQNVIAKAGSEFVHSSKVKREFLSNVAGKSGESDSFQWCLSMIAMSVQIPVNYFCTHLSGGQNRASAVVATEPVAKKWEMRQLVLERVIRDLWDGVMKRFGIDADCEVTLPDIITADRSQKLKDLDLAESRGWISKKRAAIIAAKELGITRYEYDEEQKDIKEDPPLDLGMDNPLTASPGVFGVSSEDRSDIKDQNS